MSSTHPERGEDDYFFAGAVTAGLAAGAGAFELLPPDSENTAITATITTAMMMLRLVNSEPIWISICVCLHKYYSTPAPSGSMILVDGLVIYAIIKITKEDNMSNTKSKFLDVISLFKRIERKEVHKILAYLDLLPLPGQDDYKYQRLINECVAEGSIRSVARKNRPTMLEAV